MDLRALRYAAKLLSWLIRERAVAKEATVSLSMARKVASRRVMAEELMAEETIMTPLKFCMVRSRQHSSMAFLSALTRSVLRVWWEISVWIHSEVELK